MSLLLEGFTIISFGKDEEHSTAYPQWSAVAIQLAVVPGLHISPVVLIEVGQAVIHEDIALRGETDGETVTHIQTVKSQERKTHTSVNLPFEVLHHWWHFHFGGHGGHENAEWAGNCKLRAKCVFSRDLWSFLVIYRERLCNSRPGLKDVQLYIFRLERSMVVMCHAIL